MFFLLNLQMRLLHLRGIHQVVGGLFHGAQTLRQLAIELGIYVLLFKLAPDKSVGLILHLGKDFSVDLLL